VKAEHGIITVTNPIASAGEKVTVLAVPAAKYKAYAKLLAKKGQKKTVKIKK